MEREFIFPVDGWKFSSSNSTGAAMLYHDIPKVVVREFPISEREIAKKTYQYLQSCGILSAKFEEVELTNKKLVIYVFSERQEFISNLGECLAGLIISA